MDGERVVDMRLDREIYKTIITPGDYNVVPYEDSRCKITVSDVECIDSDGPCEIEPECVIFSEAFDGNVLIGDMDSFIDKDVELILQRMCSGELSTARIIYMDGDGKIAKEISFKIHLLEVTEEQLISDWSWNRLYESANHHKEKGVALVRERRIVDAFRRFSKALKMIVAIEPIDPEVIDDEQVKKLIDVKVKLYNNLAHCQLQFNEYEAALELCNRALNHDPVNIKSFYRRCLAYAGLKMYEEAWADIQNVLILDPDDRSALAKAREIRPKVQQINQNYSRVIRNMFN